MRRMAIALFAVIFLLSGCGQKKEVEVPAAVSAPQIPAALPELEQNKIFERNRPQTPHDFSFQPVPDEQEPAPPQAAVGNQPPLVD